MDEILKAWGHQELITSFKENDIKDLEYLYELLENPEAAKEVIPSVGIRLSLKKKLKELNEQQQSTKIEFIDFNLVEHSLSHEDPILNQTPEQVVTEQIEDDFEVVGSARNITLDQPVISDFIQQLNLENIIRQHPLGPSIIKIYEVKQELCSTCHSYLCDIIITHVLKYENRRLENGDFYILTNKILELFPSECSQTYYVPPVLKKNSKINKSERSKGKLVDKYRNKLTFIREANKLKDNKICSVESNEIVVSEASQSKQWLVTHRDEIYVQLHWITSYSARKQDFENKEYKNITDIYENWPILRETSSYELIERDFLMKHQVPFSNFTSKWNLVIKVVLQLYKTKFSKEEKILYDSCNNSKPQVFAPKSNKITVTQQEANTQCSSKGAKSAKKSFWKPTKLDALEGIILHVKIPGDIENAVSKKRKNMSDMGLSLQPFIIIVGSEWSTISKVYVRVDEVMYEVSSILRAVDVLFKVYLTFNLTYPPETENLYYFIQWSIYEIHTNSDTEVPAVCTILNKVKNRLKNQ